MKARCLISDSNDPYFNLATEDWIFHDLDPEQHILFLWRNEECVILGRNQNPWTECDVQKLKENNVNLVRRHSGGGTVYQDLGNSIFTFLSSKEKYDKKRNFSIIINALQRFNIKAEQIGRNDILVQEKKISGSAFKEKQDRAFHHGTLMINVDLNKLEQYLTPSKRKLISKGTKSVRSRVSNIATFNPEITHDALMEAIIDEFFKTYDAEKNIETLNKDSLKEIPSLKRYYEKLKSDSWVYGETPEFTHKLEERFDWGGVEVLLNCKEGKIKETKIFSDALNAEMIKELENKLTNIDYNKDSVRESINDLKSKLTSSEQHLEEFSNWMASLI